MLLATLVVFACAKPAASPADDVFLSKVRPILQKSCSPCHEKGGKMYARIPFDDPQALRSHVPGVRKRLKGDDLAAFEAWLAEKPQ